MVILDEAQQLPRDFQKPITDMMRVLARDYGVTFVLCTATPPELGKNIDAFGRTILEGLPDVREIVADKITLSEKTAPRPYQNAAANGETQSWQEIADEIAARPCVLAVVNTRSTPKNSLPPCLLTASNCICPPICAPRTAAK